MDTDALAERVGTRFRVSSRVVARYKEAIIRREEGQYCVRSPDNPEWSGGCYPSKEEAEKRLRQVEYFKNEGSSLREA